MFEKIVSHGTLVAVTVLIVCVLGIVAALNIPVQMIPDLEVRTISVRTSWPGATPQDMEKEILIEQEEYLRNLPNLERMVSSASSGTAEIELEFPFSVDITETLIQVNNSLSQVPSYPENVDQPRIIASSFSSNSFMYFRVSPLDGNPQQLDMDLMRDFIEDNVRTRMETVQGVSQVDVWGGAERQIRLLLDASKLAERGLSVLQIRQAITERNRDVSGGELDGGKRRYLLRTVGRFDDLRDLEQLIVARQGDSVTRLGEVATVVQDHFEIQRHTYINSKPTIMLAVNRETGSNVIDIKEAMMAEMKDINEQVLIPRGMILELTADDVVYVQNSIANVWTNLGIGAVFATLVMFLFLRSVRATAVGVVGIPICTIAAFIGLMVTGRTINVISLAGVAFAIGMTIDNTIVVLENIERQRSVYGKKPLQAAIDGVRQVWPAVLASTLTTILVFVPVVFVQVEAGQLYGDIAVAVSASILASMLVAITVIPTLSAHMDFKGSARHDPKAGLLFRGIHWLISTTPRRLAAIGTTLLITTFIIFQLTPPASYLPEGEEAKAFARMNAPPGYNLTTMKSVGEELQSYLLDYVGEDPERFERGEAEVPAMKYVLLNISSGGIFVITEPVDPDHIEPLMEALTRTFETYPGMRAFVSRGSIITGNQGGTRSVSLDISGADLPTIYDSALTVYRRAQEVFEQPRIQTQPSTLTLSQPLVEIRPDWDRASELGMSAGELGFTVAALTDGAYVDEFFLEDDKIDIFAYSQDDVDANLDTLTQMPVFTPAGITVPLSTLARIEETVDTSTVRRVDGRRTVTLNIIPPKNIALETGVQTVREQVVKHLRDNGQLPSDVSIEISGASDQLEATQQALTGNYVVALVIVYLLLVAIFTHWGYPLLIMTTIPMGVASGIVGLVLMNLMGQHVLPFFGQPPLTQPFDMISMLGFLILMGTVVNNPILVVHKAIDNLKENDITPLEAVTEAVESRLRPILMSTLTTLCGLAPLVFLPGEGTELYRGVGAIVLFGLLGTAVVTLTFLPSLTVFLLKRSQHRSPEGATSEIAS
ncbi:MAG: efflux RND transporter permease subunit [Ketobacteraceae bacterium]|nr:efflux RND transporter permease subunit [Ketobacteraceae bacterium]